jgi:hypothetical protein
MEATLSFLNLIALLGDFTRQAFGPSYQGKPQRV